LFLTTAEFYTSFTNDGVVSLREHGFIINEIVGIGHFASLVNVFIGKFVAVEAITNILSNRA